MMTMVPTFAHDDHGSYFCSDDQWFLLLPTMTMTYLFPKMMPKLTPVVPFAQDDPVLLTFPHDNGILPR
jgi:hypothetical protein